MSHRKYRMSLLTVFASIIIVLFVVSAILLFFFQTRLIFYPAKLPADFRFRLNRMDEELFIDTRDGERINALLFRSHRQEVILYFHGNAGDLSGWQHVAEDFTQVGYNVMIIDYRGYGKSTGKISERGFYQDAEAAYYFLINEKGFTPQNIIVYGRSVGSGVAVELASKRRVKGMVLESPYISLPKLANEKLPFFFPSLYLRYRFDTRKKINLVKSPVIFIHGLRDTLIPASHSKTLYEVFQGKKKLILLPKGGHNDLNSFPEYQYFLTGELAHFLTN